MNACDIAATRKVLLTIIENLVKDEAESDDPSRRIPSTRELGTLIATRAQARADSLRKPARKPRAIRSQ
jgi:MarR family transcriptional regulator, organic hydroperoxide resistance regulator